MAPRPWSATIQPYGHGVPQAHTGHGVPPSAIQPPSIRDTKLNGHPPSSRHRWEPPSQSCLAYSRASGILFSLELSEAIETDTERENSSRAESPKAHDIQHVIAHFWLPSRLFIAGRVSRGPQRRARNYKSWLQSRPFIAGRESRGPRRKTRDCNILVARPSIYRGPRVQRPSTKARDCKILVASRPSRQ